MASTLKHLSVCEVACGVLIAGLAVIVAFGVVSENFTPPHTTERVRVLCSECMGDGSVTYRSDHVLVKGGIVSEGTYTCPICGGNKFLEIER